MGFEPTASLILNQCGLPVAYRAKLHKHAPRDLNPDRPGWNRSCCHYTRGVNYLSHQAAVAGIEPASRRLTVAHPYQHEYHRIIIILLHHPVFGGVRVAGFEPAISCFQGTRVRPDFPTPCLKIAPSGNRTRTSAMARQQATVTSWARICFS